MLKGELLLRAMLLLTFTFYLYSTLANARLRKYSQKTLFLWLMIYIHLPGRLVPHVPETKYLLVLVLMYSLGGMHLSSCSVHLLKSYRRG